MSRGAEITLEWAGGEHVFRLRIGELRRLQEETGVGPLEQLARLKSGSWRVDDVVAPIRYGLIGGGDVTEAEARRLVRSFVEDAPLARSASLAAAILNAALVGAPDERVGKPVAAESGSKTPEASSASPPSTASVP